MHRIDADGHVANHFGGADPSTGLPGTKVDPAWLNAVQEAIAGVIEGAGIALVKGDDTQLLDALAAFIAAHNALTNPHSATSSPTASRLALRDAAGRAQFADPAAAQDAATKAYTDGKFPAVSWTGLPVDAASWTALTGDDQLAYWKDSAGVVHLRGGAISTAAPSMILNSTALPVGLRPKASRVFAVFNTTDQVVAEALVLATGVINFNPLPTASKQYRVDGISFVAEQ